jgi:tRNA(fMet)-specific endonuclease VapC
LRYLLDTNACIVALRRPGSAVGVRILATPQTDVFISTATVAELLIGPRRAKKPAGDLAATLGFVSTIQHLPFDSKCADTFATVGAAMMDVGDGIEAFDLMIAVTAIAHGLTLVTHNVRHFQHVPGLVFEDWQT